MPRLPLWLAVLPLASLQQGPARYTEAQLACASFREAVATDIRTTIGSVVRHERAGRDGVLMIRTAASDSGLALTAWYDSLVVWREGPEGRVAPDAEGLLGGRWRGILDRSGRYAALAVPFIPDEVAEIAELRGVLQDFFPLLPDSALADGARYAWTRRATTDSTTAVQDTVALPVRRETEETGNLLWDQRLGPVRWERTLAINARIAAGGPFRRGVVTEVTQRVRVERQNWNCVNGER